MIAREATHAKAVNNFNAEKSNLLAENNQRILLIQKSAENEMVEYKKKLDDEQEEYKKKLEKEKEEYESRLYVHYKELYDKAVKACAAHTEKVKKFAEYIGKLKEYRDFVKSNPLPKLKSQNEIDSTFKKE